VSAAATFAAAIRSSIGQKREESAVTVAQGAGTVWEKCDVLAKGAVSHNAGEACTRILRAERAVVADAVRELEEAMAEDAEGVQDDDDEFGSSWSKEEREMVAPGLGLMKTAQATLRRAAEAVASGECSHSGQMDETTDGLIGLSAAVDDLASSLHSPVNCEEAAGAFEALRSLLTAQVESLLLRPFVSDAHRQSWGQLVRKGISHNQDKMEAVLVKMNVAKITLDA